MQVAVFAKAPRAGTTKTRLIPALGAAGAARLQRLMALRTLDLARRLPQARVTLWAAPDGRHRFFRALERCRGIVVRAQEGDHLGARMARAFAANDAPTILIGCDCPALDLEHLSAVATLLAEGRDAIFIPAEDGGYVLVALRRPQPRIFEGIVWGSAQVMEQTRVRLRELGLNWAEPATLWDLDRPKDLHRLRELVPRDDGLASYVRSRTDPYAACF